MLAFSIAEVLTSALGKPALAYRKVGLPKFIKLLIGVIINEKYKFYAILLLKMSLISISLYYVMLYNFNSDVKPILEG